MAADKELFLVAQLDPGEDDPDRDALYDLGVIATAMQLLKLPDGTVRVLVEGVKRAQLVSLVERDGYMAAEIEEVPEEAENGPEAQALMRSVLDQFENYAKHNKRLPPETGIQLSEIEDASLLADAVASNLSVKVADKQALLGELNPSRRLEMVFAFMPAPRARGCRSRTSTKRRRRSLRSVRAASWCRQTRSSRSRRTC